LTSLLFLAQALEVVMMMSSRLFKINQIVYLGLYFLPAFHVVFVCVHVFIWQIGFILGLGLVLPEVYLQFYGILKV